MNQEIQVKSKAPLTTSTALSKVVQAYNDSKLKDSPIQDVKEWIKKVFIILGLPKDNMPEVDKERGIDEFTFLAQSIRTELAYYTLKEMEYAVKLAINGTIKDSKGKDFDVTFYKSKFSLTWIVRLMKAYKDYRAKDAGFRSHLKSLAQPPEKSKLEQYLILKKGLMELWERFKSGEQIFDELEWYYYSTLDEYCDLFNPSKESKLDAMKRAEPLMEAKLKADKEKALVTKGMIAAAMPTKPTDLQLKDKAKELLMRDFFKSLLEMDMNLELPKNI